MPDVSHNVRFSKARLSHDTAAKSVETLEMYLSYRPPYNWQALREFLRARIIDGVEKIAEDRYERFFWLRAPEEASIVCKGWFCAKHEAKYHQFKIQLKLEKPQQIKQVLQAIRRILDLDADAVAIERALLRSGVPKTQLMTGIRIPGTLDAFEAGCRAVLGQQVSVSAAVKLTNQLAKTLGTQDQNGGLYFPTPWAVAQSDLAFMKLPGARKAALIALADYCCDHTALNSDDLDAWLAIKGIGPWTIAYAKLRGLSQPDIWLSSDGVIKKRLQNHVVIPEKAQPWRSYLTFQLWSMT